MPVHLGSMGESVRTIIDRVRARCGRGDVFVLNAPYNGGTHLPDVTVIAPVFLPSPQPSPRKRGEGVVTAPLAPQGRGAGGEGGNLVPEFFVASRGHHADIGGITPGSMPPDSTHVDEEGVLLDNVQLVAQGRFLEGEMRAHPRRRALSGAQHRAEPGGPARASGGVREGRGGARQDGRALHAARRARVHERTCRTTPRRRCVACSARCPTARSSSRWTAARASASRSPSTASDARRRSTSPARARSSRRTSTRRPQSARRRCSTCSARSWTTRSR